MGGQTSRLGSDATAYMERDARFVMNVHARWETPEEDEPCISRARSFFDAAAPYASGGAYVNFMTEEEAARVAAVYGSKPSEIVSNQKKI